jgi:hypothetical protein
MIRREYCLIALLASATPVLAQQDPFRVVNGARVPAVALNVVPTGHEGWGPNQLTHGPLEPGGTLSMRPPESAGCRFDFRLQWQDGQEAIRRDADICKDRTVVLGGDGAPPRP